jgi:hypothetical protein
MCLDQMLARILDLNSSCFSTLNITAIDSDGTAYVLRHNLAPSVHLFAVVNTGFLSLCRWHCFIQHDPHPFKTYPSCLGDNRLFNLDLQHFDRVYSYLYARLHSLFSPAEVGVKTTISDYLCHTAFID